MTAPSFVEVVQHLRPGGIERLALDLALEPPVDGRGLLVSLEGNRESCLAAWPALQAWADRIVFLGKRPGFDPTLPPRLARLLWTTRARWVHSHHLGPLLYAGAAVRLLPGLRWVHTEHDAWHLTERRQADLTRRCAHLLRPRLTAVGNAVATGLAESRINLPVHVIHNGVDTLRFSPGDRPRARQAVGLAVGETIVGVAGRLEPEKNQALAIEALALVTAPRPLLALAGNGSLRQDLEALARRRGVADRTIFLGHVEDMPSFYRAIDLFCLPSRAEGLPLSLIEAQACGIPAVSTDVGACREAVCPDSGAVVPPGDPAALADAWSALLGRAPDDRARAFALRRGDAEGMRRAYRQVFS